MTETEKATEAKPKQTRLSANQVAERLDKVVESTNEAVDSLKHDIEEIGNTNKAILEFMQNQSKAINNPVILTDRHEADEQELGKAEDIGESQIITGVFDISSPQFQDKDRILKFMDEKVTVHVHESNSDLEVGVFSISVNNKRELFKFGETKTVPRYIVEGLARAKPVHYKNEEYTNNQGIRGVRNPGTKGLRYPFSVEYDPNPVGRQWLNCVLSQD